MPEYISYGSDGRFLKGSSEHKTYLKSKGFKEYTKKDKKAKKKIGSK